MLALLQAGKIYGADPGQGCFETYIDREAVRNNKDLLNKP